MPNPSLDIAAEPLSADADPAEGDENIWIFALASDNFNPLIDVLKVHKRLKRPIRTVEVPRSVKHATVANSPHTRPIAYVPKASA